jgi:hypothetical protein
VADLIARYRDIGPVVLCDPIAQYDDLDSRIDQVEIDNVVPDDLLRTFRVAIGWDALDRLDGALGDAR